MPTQDVEAARPAHVARIANRMRDIDRLEVGVSGRSPKAALRAALAASALSWTGTTDGEPVCMFGVAPLSLIDGIGTPWLLATDDFPRAQRAILKLAPPLLAAMESYYPRLENRIAVDNVTSRRWLERLGFAFDEEIVYVRGVAFRRFSKGF